MPDSQCPRCTSRNVISRTVNDRLRAADPSGETFDVALRLPVWNCLTCRYCWEREEAFAVKETAYQNALAQRAPGRPQV